MQTNSKITNPNFLVDQNYWDSSYEDLPLQIISEKDTLRQWIQEYIPPIKENLKCFEIGCYPGRYLAVMGELGFELNGIDLTSHVKTKLPEWLISQKYKVGTFKQMSVFDIDLSIKYDIVCSFGFIEHFKNWEEVLKIHASLVSFNGILMLETPNFSGCIQKFIHKNLDNENYCRHYVPSMNPEKWKEILESFGFEVKEYGYIGKFEFWTDKKPVSLIKKQMLWFFNRITPILRKIKSGSHSLSPYCVLVAKKIT